MTTWSKGDSASFRVQARTAAKTRRVRCCGGLIRTGERYLMHVELPGGDAGYADTAGHPVQMPECARCATRYGRGHLLGEATDTRSAVDQVLAEWDGDNSFATPADLAERLREALDGAR
jgi:hypothetical protein